MPDNKKDDKSIRNECSLLRRIPNRPNMYVTDNITKTRRPSSANFKGVEELSTENLDLLLADHLDHNHTIKDYPDFGVVSLTAGFVRTQLSAPQSVVADPITEPEPNPYHALIVGPKTQSTAKEMVLGCTIVVNPKMDVDTDIV